MNAKHILMNLFSLVSNEKAWKNLHSKNILPTLLTTLLKSSKYLGIKKTEVYKLVFGGYLK